MKHVLSRIFFTSIFYVLILTNLNAQTTNHFVEQIGIEKGLSSNYPNSIIQDSKGFIWIGTNNGLNRYDGYQYKVFKYDANNTNTISDNLITNLLEDSYGNIWIATSGGGLNLYHTTTGVITRFKHKKNDATSISSNVVHQIYEDSKSRLWVATKNGLNLFDQSTMTFKSWLQPNNCQKCKYSIKAIVEDHNGNLWIGDEFYGLYYFNPSNGEFTKPHLKYTGEHQLPSDFIHDLDFSKGTLWVGTDHGLALLNTLTETYEILPLDNINDRDFIQDVYIWSIYNDSDGSIWLCTNGNGLINYQLGTNKISVYKSDGNSDYKIGNNLVQDVLVDKSKNIWIATRGNGLNKFNLKNLIFKHWENDDNNSNSLINNDVRAMLQDADGTIWIGTSNGLSRFNPASNLFKNYIKDFNYKADIKKPKIRSIYRSESNDLWVGTQGGALYKYNQKQDRFMLAEGFANSPLATKIRHIEIIYEPEDGTLWLGTIGTGFLAYNTLTNEYKTVYPKNNLNDALLNLYVNCTLKASETELWVGSNRGLILLNTNTLKFKLWEHKEDCDSCIVGNKIRSLYRDSNNNIWVGTRNGLAIFDPKSEKFKNYGINEGLPSDIIYGILPDLDGNIWLTTPNGLSRVTPSNMEFKNITIPENNILDMGGHALGLNGSLLVGGTTGFTIFNPNDIKTNPYLPEVVFTDIKINNKSMDFDKSISQLTSIDLLYDQNNLTFEFSALEFTNSQINKYKYKLEGFNDKWVENGTKHDLTFTNLDPKKYVLKIKGSNNEGVWNEQETSLIINITPPWWGTLWFKILSILIFFGSIFTIYYLRINQLKRREASLQKEVSKQTKELVKNNKELEELHREKDGIIGIVAHDLRGPLNNIYGLSQLLEDNENLDEDQKTYIRYINESVESGNSLITDLLIMSNVNHPEKRIDSEDFNLSEFIEEWEKSYITRLDQKDQNLRKHLGKDSLKIHADKKLVGRIFDNLMTNAIKFSNKGSTIELTAKSRNDFIDISFKDYGPGMSDADKKMAFKMFQKLSARPTAGESSHGLGLAIVKTLVEKLQGSIIIESKLGEGTEFIVSLPEAKM
ncbi:MAG: two-component regulator propeller domain-containing protein [Algibacter sp.]|uniref:ligand-binding sensor domain-containing protein n=1 Tax=Algibacter sp. TaxID=1872428 RepID=UPI003297C8CE